MYQPYHEPLMPTSAWEVLPSHYEEHVKEKNAKVCALMREMSECEAFVFFADAHVRQNSMASVPIIRSILENTEVKKVIYGGDTVSDSLLDVILIDCTSGRIQSVRYGGGKDRIIREATESNVGS
ncbi:MAG: hypothetical protein IJW50_01390 [Clostridia bacterium]|nr:hypothetical protein [Clostridia bacterium]